jgi:hypothetical protein
VGAQGPQGGKGDKGDAGPYPTGMMVVDATGTVVGTWMGDAVLMKFDGVFYRVAYVDAYGFGNSQLPYFYQSADCTGQKYFPVSSYSFAEPGVFVLEDINEQRGTKGTIVVPTGPIVKLAMLSSSFVYNSGPVCFPADGIEYEWWLPKSFSVDFQSPFSLQ